MNSFHIFLLTLIISESLIWFVNLFRQIKYGKTVLHYNVASFFLIIGQSFLFLIKDWKRMDHTFVYLNECQLETHDENRQICSPFWKIRAPIQGIDEGIISASDFTIYQSLGMALIYTFTISHFLYAANRKTYDHSIKWIEYVFSSSLQTMILYSLFGQVGQVIWVAMGLKMLSMMLAYGIECIMIQKNEDGLLSKFINKYTGWFLFISFLGYFFFHYGPLFVRNYSKTSKINGTVTDVDHSEQPIWAYFFFASTVVCDALFPFFLYKHREDLTCVNADIDFSLSSMVSKITFNSILLIGLFERHIYKDLGSGVLILCLWISGGILYWRIPRPQKKTTKRFCNTYDLLTNQ